MNGRFLANATLALIIALFLNISDTWASNVSVEKISADYFVKHRTGLYRIIVPKAGAPNLADVLAETWNSVGDTTSNFACLMTLGNAGKSSTHRFALEGLLSNKLSIANAATLAPTGHSVRLLLHPTILHTEQVFIPDSIASEIEKLTSNPKSFYFTDYSIVLLIYEQWRFCEKMLIVADFVPIGRAIRPDLMISDASDKAKYYIDIGIKIANIVAKLKGK